VVLIYLFYRIAHLEYTIFSNLKVLMVDHQVLRYLPHATSFPQLKLMFLFCHF